MKRDYLSRVQRRERKEKPLHNPYFRPQRRLDPKKRWRFAMGGGLLGLLIGLLSFFLSSPWFALKSFRVESNMQGASLQASRDLVREHLSERRFFGLFLSSNRFLFHEEGLRQAFLARKAYDTLTLHREGHELVVTLQEKQGRLLVHEIQTDTWSLVDDTGQVLELLSAEEAGQRRAPTVFSGPTRDGSILQELPDLLQIAEFGPPKQTLRPGSSVLHPELPIQLFRLSEHLASQGLHVTQIDSNASVGTWVTVHLEEGFDILVEPFEDLEGQEQRLTTMLTQIPRESITSYIDIRFGDHVYVK